MSLSAVKTIDQADERLEAFIRAFARAQDITRASAEAGVSASTGQRWMREPAIVSRIQELRGLRLFDAGELLLDEVPPSVRAAIAIRDDVTAPHKDRMTAIRTILEYALKVRSEAFIAKRLAVLEATLAEVGRTSPALPTIDVPPEQSPTS